MTKKFLLFIVLFLTLFLFSGCVPSSPYPYGGEHHPINWGDLTNVDDDVDISDLDLNMTEEEMNLTEEEMETRVQRIPFPVEEYRQLATYGKGTIKGSVYLTNLLGDKIPGRGTRLYLNPVTSYSDQWFEESYLGGAKMEKADPRLFNYLRFTAADSDGNFAFYGVPSGSYYLIGTVKCGNECGFERPKNIRIATQVTVTGNRIVHKDLTRVIE